MSEPNASVSLTVEEAHFIKNAFEGVTVKPTIPGAADYCRGVVGIVQKCDAIIAREVAKQAENPTDGTEPDATGEATQDVSGEAVTAEVAQDAPSGAQQAFDAANA